jgi:hypothetical protein
VSQSVVGHNKLGQNVSSGCRSRRNFRGPGQYRHAGWPLICGALVLDHGGAGFCPALPPHIRNALADGYETSARRLASGSAEAPARVQPEKNPPRLTRALVRQLHIAIRDFVVDLPSMAKNWQILTTSTSGDEQPYGPSRRPPSDVRSAASEEP